MPVQLDLGIDPRICRNPIDRAVEDISEARADSDNVDAGDERPSAGQFEFVVDADAQLEAGRLRQLFPLDGLRDTDVDYCELP
jgi:hypothetical protein